MGDIAIRVERLGKRYRIGSRQAAYATLRETVMDLVAGPLRRLRGDGHRRQRSETIWALKEVSFQVERGEIVGIIGRNGAGKTTLLKILSRVTDPTEGYAELDGRVGSLLEVGTGFHPELTGRENTYLNGAILGMKKTEVDRRFDEIVAFAEVEKFIDTPVKHYSSGMYLRLAFAVAAHLEPETLLVDEVLAVGDLAFQRKCLGKMGEVAQTGRTVLFVSHNLAAVDTLCRSGIVLDQGRVVMTGTAAEAIRHYTLMLQAEPEEAAQASGAMAVRNLRVFGGQEGVVQPDRGATVEFTLEIRERLWNPQVLLVMRDPDQRLIIRDVMASRDLPQLSQPGTFKVEVSLPAMWLSPGLYSFHIKATDDALEERKRCASDPVLVHVVQSRAGSFDGKGLLSPRTEWTVRSN